MTTRAEVLSALSESDGRLVSGQILARSLGVSRVAVGKHVTALRSAGYTIDAVRGSGYVLVARPDSAAPWEVAPLVTSDFWVRFEGAEQTASTNDDARALARAGAPEGTVVLASRQTGGRGRLGRAWDSPAGGAYFSAVLRPRVAPADVSSLSLAIALGVALGLERLGVAPRLKWPNDVLLGTGKLAGVLLEMAAESDSVDWVVAGVGLNVRLPHGASKLADAGLAPAYVAQAVPDVTVAAAAAAALDGIADSYGRWRAGGFSAIKPDYEARFALVGKEVSVRDLSGTVHAEGDVTGVDKAGRLLVRGDGGVAAVSAGEVTLRGA